MCIFCTICKDFTELKVIPMLSKLVSLSLPNVFEVNYKYTKNLSSKIDATSYDYTVEYIYSNKDVATVDKKDNVKGVSTGDAIITCTVRDKYGNTLTNTCDVTVSLSWW